MTLHKPDNLNHVNLLTLYQFQGLSMTSLNVRQILKTKLSALITMRRDRGVFLLHIPIPLKILIFILMFPINFSAFSVISFFKISFLSCFYFFFYFYFISRFRGILNWYFSWINLDFFWSAEKLVKLLIILIILKEFKAQICP